MELQKQRPYSKPTSQDHRLPKPSLAGLAQTNHHITNTDIPTNNPSFKLKQTKSLPTKILNLDHCIKKEYIRLIIKTRPKSAPRQPQAIPITRKKGTKKKNQIPNLPYETRKKLYDIARRKIFKNHEMGAKIPEENMAKLYYKWPTHALIEEKEIEKEKDSHIMSKDIKPCPEKCSKCPKIRATSKKASKKRTKPIIPTKKKPTPKLKPKTTKKKAQVLYPILSKEQIIMDQDKARLLVYERHQTFLNTNGARKASNPLVTKGRISEAVANPMLRTPRLLEIAQGIVKEDTARKNVVNKISNYSSWTPIKMLVETRFQASPKAKPYEESQKTLTEKKCKEQCLQELIEDENTLLQDKNPDQQTNQDMEIRKRYDNFPEVIARITNKPTHQENETQFEHWQGVKQVRILTPCTTNEQEEALDPLSPNKISRIKNASPVYQFTPIDEDDNNHCICKNSQCKNKARTWRYFRKGKERINKIKTTPKDPQIEDNQHNQSERLYTKLIGKQDTPYLKIGLLEHECKGLIDTGSTLPIISLKLANTLENSKAWKEQHKQNLCYWDKSVNTNAVGCNGKPIKFQGIMTIPDLTFNEQQLGVTSSFWVMENSTDDIILSANWMHQLRFIIDIGNHSLTYHLTKNNLYPDNVIVQLKPNPTDEPLEESTEHTKEDSKICKITIAGTHVIKPHRAATITLKWTEAQQISKVFTDINKTKACKIDTVKEKKASKQFRKKLEEDHRTQAIYLPPLDPTDTTLPVTVSGMLGLLCQQQKGRKHVRLIIPNVGETALQLQKTLYIRPRKPPEFLTTENNNQKQVVMQIEPKMEDQTILTINKMGTVRRIHKSNLTKTEKDTLAHLHRQYNNYNEAEATINQVFPNKELDKPRQTQEVTLPSTTEEYQNLFYRKERHITDFKKPSNITVDTDSITLTRFPLIGELPFTDTTDRVSLLFFYLLTSQGQEMGLTHCTTEVLEMHLTKIPIKIVKQYRFKMMSARDKHDIMYLYKKIPLSILAETHLRFIMINEHIRNAEDSKRTLVEILDTKVALKVKLYAEVQAFSTLFFYGQALVAKETKIWGVEPFFAHQKIRHKQLEQINLEEISTLPATLKLNIIQAQEKFKQRQDKINNKNCNKKDKKPKTKPSVTSSHRSKTTRNIYKHRVRATATSIIRKKEDLDNIIVPKTQGYCGQTYNREEREKINSRKYQDLQTKANKSIFEGIPNNMDKITHIDQVENFTDFINYHKSTAALHNHMSKVTGEETPKKDTHIPIPTFKKSLTQIEITDYNNNEKTVIEEAIPEGLRHDFKIFTQLLRHPVSRDLGRKMLIPDFPPTSYFEDEDKQPSALHDLQTGLVLPEWLAFICSPIFCEKAIIFEEEYKFEFTHLATVLYMYGQFCMSLHSGSVGLFRKDVFLARALLNNCTEVISKPSKQLTTARDVHIDDKLDYLLCYEKAVEITGCPFTVTLRMLRKKPKEPTQMAFPSKSPVLKELLDLPNRTKQDLRNATNSIEKQNQELKKHIMTTEEHDKYIKMSGLHKIRFTRATKPNAKGRTIPMKIFKESKIQKELRKFKTFTTWHSDNIVKIEQLKLPMITEDNEDDTNKTKSMTKTWILPNQSKIDQIKTDSYKKVHHINPDIRVNARVTFGRATKIFLVKPSEQNYRAEPIVPVEIYPSPADQALDRILNLCQSIGPNSTNLLKQHKTETNIRSLYREEPKHKRYIIKYVIPQEGPDNNKRQQRLRALKTYNYLVAETSNSQFNDNKITENDNDYKTIKNIAIHQHEEKEHTEDLSRATLASIKQQDKGSLFTSSILSSILPKTDQFKMAIHKVMCITDRINIDLVINKNPIRNITRTPTHIDELIGRAAIEPDNESTTLASNIAKLVTESIRRLFFQKPLKTSTEVDNTAPRLVAKLVPNSTENWASVTIEEAVKAQGGIDNLIQTVSNFFSIPILIAVGSLKAGEYNGKKTSFFNTESMKIYGSNHSTTQKEKGAHAAMAVTKDGKEFFKFNTYDKNHSKQFIGKSDSPEIQELSKQQAVTRMQAIKLQDTELGLMRFIPVEYEHLALKMWFKKHTARAIMDARNNNQCQMETETSYQSKSDIENILANCLLFTSLDFTGFYDQIGCDLIMSMLNCISYLGKEIAPLIAPQGAKNSCLYAMEVITTVLTKVDDMLILQDAKKPRQPNTDRMDKPTRQMTILESWKHRVPLDMPGPKLVLHTIMKEVTEPRDNLEDQDRHPLNLTAQQRKEALKEGKHNLIKTVQLIDDCAIGTNLPKTNTKDTKKQEDKKLLLMHTLILKQIFLTLVQCSTNNAKEGFQPAKVSMKKSAFCEEAVMHLGKIYQRGQQIIDINHFKNTSRLGTLPTTGAELVAMLSFFNYFAEHIENLSHLAAPLRAMGETCQGAQKIKWTPTTEKHYKTIITCINNIGGLSVLPDDPNQVDSIVITSDACNKTIAYTIGAVIHKEVTKKDPTSMQQSKLSLIRSYSCHLKDNIKNAPIAAKECLAATQAIISEEKTLQYAKGKPIYLVIDNSVLFSLLEQMKTTAELENHFFAHPQLKEKVTDLYLLMIKHNITLLTVASKLQIADVLTRVPCERATSKNEDCKLCPGCKTTCHIAPNHQKCKFNIRNGDNSKPNLLKYDQITENKLDLGGKTINYNTYSTNFNPKNYKEIDITRIINLLDENSSLEPYEPEDSETQELKEILTHAKENTTQDYTKHRIDEMKEAMEDVTLLTQQKPNETLLETTDQQPLVRRTYHQQQENMINHYNPTTYHTSIKPMKREYWRVLKNVYTETSNIKWNKQANKSVIILFANRSKSSLRNKNSLYLQGLNNTKVKKIDRNPMEIRSVYIKHNQNNDFRQHYILATSPTKTPGSETHNTALFLQQLTKIHLYLLHHKEQEHPTIGKHIIFDGDLIGELYGLDKQTATIAITMIMGKSLTQNKFESIGVQSCLSPIKAYATKAKLKRTIRVLINGLINVQITTTLDKRGRSPDLIQEIGTKANLRTYPNKITLIFDDLKVKYAPQLNLATARFIAITIPEDQIPYLPREIRKAQQKICTITDFRNTDHDPKMELILGKQKIAIAQSQDAKLLYLREQANTALKNGKQLIEGNIHITIIDDILKAKNINDTQFKPILPQNMTINEIFHTHQLLKCSSTAEQAVNEIRKFYHHSKVTSSICLNKIASFLIPCRLCKFGSTISMKRGFSAYGQTRNIASNIAGHTCSVIAHDILYIQMKSTRKVPKPYLSLFTCYGCGSVDIESQTSTSGNLIAKHLLNFILLTGIPPHLVITDSASTEIKGEVRRLISNCNIIFNKLNRESIIKTSKPTSIGEKEQTQDNGKVGYLDQAITKLTTRQRELLLKDIKINSEPALHRPILTHSPTPYLGMHPQSSTSLGIIDAKCKQIATFCRRELARNNTQEGRSNTRGSNFMETLVKAFAYHNNFLKPDNKTKIIPAILHLGNPRALNIPSLANSLLSSTHTSSQVLNQFQEMLQIADNERKAEENRMRADNKAKKKHLDKHRTIMDDEDFDKQCKMLSLILIKSDKQQTKMSREPPVSGPHVVIYIDIKIKNVLAMELTTGIIFNRSYRNITRFLPNPTLLSTSMYSTWSSAYQQNILPRELAKAPMSIANNEEQYKNILSNLIHLYDLLINILPPVEDTMKRIVINDTDLEYEEPINSSSNQEDPESNSDEEINQENEGNEADSTNLTVTLALTQEQEEKQKAKEKDEPDLIGGPITRSKNRAQPIPTATTQPKTDLNKKEKPKDMHPIRPPPRRSNRRQYLNSNGEPTDKAPSN